MILSGSVEFDGTRKTEAGSTEEQDVQGNDGEGEAFALGCDLVGLSGEEGGATTVVGEVIVGVGVGVEEGIAVSVFGIFESATRHGVDVFHRRYTHNIF